MMEGQILDCLFYINEQISYDDRIMLCSKVAAISIPKFVIVYQTFHPLYCNSELFDECSIVFAKLLFDLKYFYIKI